MTERLDRPPPALEVRALGKSFAGVPVLKAFELTVSPGEVHALVGENGSGKSTFIKILSGFHQPDGGEARIGGCDLEFGVPASAYALGARFVHQDLALVDSGSVADNLALGSTNGFPTRLATIDRRSLHRQARDDLARVNLDLDPATMVGDLPLAEKTGVAIARAIRRDPALVVKLLVLDEATATLESDEVHRLHAIVRAVAAEGVAVIYVTHRLDEVYDLARTVTVLRDGRKVRTLAVTDVDREGLIELMVGTELERAAAAAATVRHDNSKQRPILDVRDVVSTPIDAVSLVARPGDLIGIAGVTGSGRDRLLATIFGAVPRQSGEVLVDNKALESSRPERAIAAGLAYLPADRKRDGAMMELGARENMTLTDLRPFWRPPVMVMRRQAELAETLSWFQRLDVRPRDDCDRQFATFSGGTQQKIMFAKWLRYRPRILLLDEPTHGVDVGAKGELHRQIVAAAARGVAVVLSSADADELVALCHQVVVLRDGRVAASLVGRQVTVASITRHSLGATVTE